MTDSFSDIVNRISQKTTRNGSLKTIKTKSERIEINSESFDIFVKENGVKCTKPEPLEVSFRSETIKEKERVPIKNPFIPFEEDLKLFELGNYVVLLNKFQVFNQHLLLLPKRFEKQTDNLNSNDFKHVVKITNEFLKDEKDDWLFFYNRGKLSGCSQLHKHIQLLRVRYDVEKNGSERFGFLKNLENNNFQNNGKFLHRYEKLNRIEDAENVFKRFLKDLKIDENLNPSNSQIVKSVCHANDDQKREIHEVDLNTDSYNCLFTSKWILLVPRKEESFKNLISCNSLCFLHSFFVKSEERRKKVDFEKVIPFITFPPSSTTTSN